MSLQIIEIGYNSQEMDRDRYSGNCLFKVEAGNGGGGTEKDFVFKWTPHSYIEPILLWEACI